MNGFPWEDSDDYRLYRADFMACAYNAAVNSDVPRGLRKMADLIRAINVYERVAGRAKLQWLVDQGVITGFVPCHPTDCHVMPGGLYHAGGCENDSNSDVSHARHKAAIDQLPDRLKWAAWPSLVG